MKNHDARYICLPPEGHWAYILPVIGLTTVLMAWEISTDMRLVSPNLIPSPGDTLGALVKMAHEGTLTKQGWASVWRIIQAIGLSAAIGVPLGILMGAFGTFEGLLNGLVSPLRTAPIVSFIPIFMSLFGVDEKMKVWFLVFGTVVYMIPTTFDAVRAVPQEMIDRAVDIGFRPLGTLWYFVIPAALPRIFEGIKVCTGIAWTYLVAAEIVNVTTGLGAVVQTAQRWSDTPKVWAGIFVILCCGVLSDYIFSQLQRRVPMLRQEKAP